MKKTIKYIYALLWGIICLLFCFIKGMAQEHSYQHYTVKEGLPQSQVISLHQDKQGYVWVGTKMGLARFDGHYFEHFSTADGLLSDQVVGYFENDNFLYFATNKGLCLFKDDTITGYPLPEGTSFTWNSGFAQSKKGEIYATADKYKIVKFYNDEYSIVNKSLPALDTIYSSSLIWDTLNNRLLISAARGLYAFKQNRLILLQKGNFHTSCFSKLEKQYCLVHRNRVSLLTGDSLETLHTRGNRSTSIRSVAYSVKNKNVLCKHRKHKLALFDKHHYEVLPKYFGQINALLIDHQNNIWIGTENGLYRSVSRAFLNYTSHNSDVFPAVYSIAEKQGEGIYIMAYSHGMQLLHENTFETITCPKHNYHISSKGFHMGAALNINNDLIAPISSGFLVYDGNTFKRYRNKPRPLHSGASYMIYVDRVTGKIYSGHKHGVSVFNKNYRIDTILNKHPGGLPRGSITSIIKDTTGRIWIGGFNGLSFYEQKQITHLPDHQFDYPHGAIAVKMDYRKNIWVGTRDGLYFFDYQKFQKIKHPDIPRNLMSIALLDSQKVYFGSMKNFGELDLQLFYNDSTDVYIYDQYNGFMGNECMQNGMFADSKKNLWIPTTDMLVKFMPGKYQKAQKPPVTEILALKTQTDDMQWKTICKINSCDEVYTIPALTEHFKINFVGLYHKSPERVKYQYRLKGYEKKWSEPTATAFATFTKLPPGEYLFELKSGIDNVWSDIQTISLRVKPAWWQTSWFLVAANIFIVAIIVSITLLVVRKMRLRKIKKLKHEQQINHMRLQTIRNQLDPHFVFNALNAMAYSVIKGNPTEAYKNITKMASLIRTSLDYADHFVRTLQDELHFVENYVSLQSYRHKNRHDYKIDMHEGIDMETKIPKMIIQNHVENAVKHGLKHREAGGLVTIEGVCDNGYIKITVTDNGIGRKRAKEIGEKSTGKGMKTLQAFYDMFNRYNELPMKHEVEDLYHADGSAAGTRVTIFIPVNYSYKAVLEQQAFN